MNKQKLNVINNVWFIFMLACFNLPSTKIRLYYVPFCQSIINRTIVVLTYVLVVGCPIIVVMWWPISKICNSYDFHNSLFGVSKPDFKCINLLCVKCIVEIQCKNLLNILILICVETDNDSIQCGMYVRVYAEIFSGRYSISLYGIIMDIRNHPTFGLSNVVVHNLIVTSPLSVCMHWACVHILSHN